MLFWEEMVEFGQLWAFQILFFFVFVDKFSVILTNGIDNIEGAVM